MTYFRVSTSLHCKARKSVLLYFHMVQCLHSPSNSYHDGIEIHCHIRINYELLICFVYAATEKGPFGAEMSSFIEQLYRVIYT